MNKTINKETAKMRRERQSQELMDAYNGGGDYEKVIKEIEKCGDTFKGYIRVCADGVVTEESFMLVYNTAQIKVFRQLPPRPQGGWQVLLISAEVICDGVNVPPKYNGRATFRKDIWK